MTHSAPPEFGRWGRIGLGLVRRARPVAVAMLLASAVSALVAGLLLRVRPGYVDLLDPSSPLQRRYLDLLHELGNVEPLHAVVEADEPARAAAFVDAFGPKAAELADETGAPLVSGVVARVDMDAIARLAPALAPPEVLEGILDDGCWSRLARADGADAADLLRCVRQRLEAAVAAGSAGARTAEGAGPGAVTAILDGLSRIASGASPPQIGSLVPPSAAHGTDAAGRLQAGPGRLLVTLMPADASNDYRFMTGFLAQVRDLARRTNDSVGGGVRVSFTGAPALIVDEMSAVRRDVALASTLSFALVTLLFFVSFNSLRHVAFAAVANAAGLALTFGAAWLLVGYLNLFSSVFAAVLAGLGIDFGIHFINFYEARRRDGLGAEAALVASYSSVVPPIALSAVTTAAAFLTVMTCEFAGFAQLGLISGVGVVLCLLTAFTLVPALLAWEARRRPAHPAGSREPWSLPLLLLPVRGAMIVAPIGLAILGLALVGAFGLTFDHDLMNLQPPGTEALSLQKDADRRVATHPAFSLAADAAEARERARRLRALPSVAGVQTPADLLVPPDPTRAALLARMGATMPALDASATKPALVPAALAELQDLERRLVELQDLAFQGGSARDVELLDLPLAAAAGLRDALADPGAEPRLLALQGSAAAWASGVVRALPTLAEHGVQPGDLPDALRGLVGRTGRIALVVVPKDPVWDRAALVRFLAEIRTVDPEVTGPAVQVGEIPELMRRSLIRASALALAVIAGLVLLSTRRLATTALSLVPMASGFALMLGLMRWLSVPLNPANLVALPLLLGIGVDGGVHLVHRWEETRDAARAIVDVGHALLVTSLTTVAGFLPLLFARHRGIRSLGAATCLGSLGMLVAVVVLAPAFLSVLDTARAALPRRRSKP